jgi:hypothetical protein
MDRKGCHLLFFVHASIRAFLQLITPCNQHSRLTTTVIQHDQHFVVAVATVTAFSGGPHRQTRTELIHHGVPNSRAFVIRPRFKHFYHDTVLRQHRDSDSRCAQPLRAERHPFRNAPMDGQRAPLATIIQTKKSSNESGWCRRSQSWWFPANAGIIKSELWLRIGCLPEQHDFRLFEIPASI